MSGGSLLLSNSATLNSPGAFNNTASLDVQSGVANLAGGGTSTGNFNVSSGADIIFSGGTHDLNTGSTLTGAGNVSVIAGTVNLNASGVDRLTGSLNVIGGNLNATGNLIDVSAQAFSPTDAALNVAGNGTVTTTGALLNASQGATVTQSSFSPLINAAGGTVNPGNGVLRIVDGAAFTGTTEIPAIQLTNTTINSGGTVTSLSSSTAQQPPSMTLAGPLLNAFNSTITASNPDANNENLLSVLDSATLTGPAKPPAGDAAALLSFSDSSLTSTGPLTAARRSLAPGTPTTIELGGPLLEASNSQFNIDSTFLSLSENAKLIGHGETALIQSNNGSSFTTTSTFVNLNNSTTGVNPGTPGPATMNLAGPLASDSGGTFNITGNFLSVNDGSALTSTTANPLIQFSGSTVTTSGGITQMSSLTDQLPSSMTLAGPLLSATNNTNIDAGSTLLFVGDSGTFNGPPKPQVGDAPALMNFTNSALVSTNPIFTVRRSLTPGTPTTANLGGPLLAANNSIFFHDSTFIIINENGRVIGTGTGALIQSNASEFAATSNFLTVNDASSAGTTNPGIPGPATVNLAGGVLNDSASNFALGSRMLFVGNGSTLNSTSVSPLFQLSGSTVNSTNNFFAATSTSTPSTVNIAGGFFSANNNTIVTSGNAGPGTVSFLLVRDGTTLTNTGIGELVNFNSSSLVSSGNFLTIDRSAAMPTTVSLNGPLLRGINGSTLSSATTASCCSFIFLAEGGALQSTGAGALTQFSASTINSGTDFLTLTDFNTASAAPSTMNLTGPLLSDIGSIFNLGRRFINVNAGSTLTSSSFQPLIQLSNSSANTANSLAQIIGAGSRVTLNGSLLSATGGTSNFGTNPAVSNDILRIDTGGQLVMTSTANPVLSFNGGTHSVGTIDTPSNLNSRLILDRGVATDATTGLGTDQPIIGPASDALPGATNPVGTLMQASGGATLEAKGQAGVGTAIRVDTALLEATLPLIKLIGTGTSDATQTILITNGPTMDAGISKIVSLGPVIALDNGLISVTNGPLINLRQGTNMSVSGDLLSLTNGSRINVVNGPLILVTGSAPTGTTPSVSTLNVSGALANFGGTGGNQIIVNNNIAPTITLSGIPVSNAGGGGTISITNPIKNPGLGSILVNPGSGLPGSVIQTTNGGRVTISGGP